jgi:hypothetical protein
MEFEKYIPTLKPFLDNVNAFIVFEKDLEQDFLSQAENYRDIVNNLLFTFTKNVVGECFTFHDETSKKLERMFSTPILTNGFFDARRLIANRRSFIWLCVQMADNIRHYNDLILNSSQSSRILGNRLLSVTLRGAPFASAISALLSCPLDIIDHLGPRHRILETTHLAGRNHRGNYIMIGDFIVAGTELKVARTYAQLRGGQLIAAQFIASALETEVYMNTNLLDVHLNALVKLGDCHEGVQFGF